ncbi:hypothetical protein ACG2F4_17845 [Halalkalibaculum sp. DA3122]|uniref:hypothetical protein n=1 Tax=Halalkalibaculum sp. DA3122 TaxID=3373607 RepID=UPI003754A2B8
MNKVIDQRGDNVFIFFSNSDDKQWVIPQRNIKTGLNLYQPSSLKGKLLKRWLPSLKNIDLVQSVIGIEERQYALSEELEVLFQKLFGIENIEFSVFGGTPSVHQKMTIQIFSEDRILGYCKVSNNTEIKKIFRHEKGILDELKQKGIEQVPECLFCGNFKEDIDLFVQTTAKTNASKTIHQWEDQHSFFLKELHEKTRRQLPFGETAFARMLDKLSQQLSRVSAVEGTVLKKGIEQVRDHYEGREVMFSMFHGDFTPWNMFVEEGELFVFDWEYAKRTCPPFMDRFHFFTQTAIFEKKMTGQEIFDIYQSIKKYFLKYINNPDLIFQCYLLTVVSQYLERNKLSGLEEDIRKHMHNWLEILNKINGVVNK